MAVGDPRKTPLLRQSVTVGASELSFDYNERISVTALLDPEPCPPIPANQNRHYKHHYHLEKQLLRPQNKTDETSGASHKPSEHSSGHESLSESSLAKSAAAAAAKARPTTGTSGNDAFFTKKVSSTLRPDFNDDSVSPAPLDSKSEANLVKPTLLVPTDLEAGSAWTHGFEVPYVFFEYHRQKLSRQRVDISVDAQDIVYEPKAVLREPKTKVSSRESTRNNSIDSENNDKGVSVLDRKNGTPHVAASPRKEARALSKDVSRNVLAPYFSIPSTTLTIPKFMDVINNPEYADFKDHFVKVCYQNHYDLNDTTFTFGGLYLSDSLDHLGIPNTTDLSKISVYFPYELPPHVNSDIIKHVLMKQSNLFFSFDPINSRIDPVENINDENYPFNINALQSSRISDRHIFFYGGWTVSVDSVEYLQNEDRWIVRKSFKLNECGYILNAFALKFTKVELRSKKTKHSGTEYSTAQPRIGSCMVSSTIEDSEGNGNGNVAGHMTMQNSSSVSGELAPISPQIVVDHTLSVNNSASRLPASAQTSSKPTSNVASQRSPPPAFIPPATADNSEPTKNALRVVTSNDLSKVSTHDTVKLAPSSIATSSLNNSSAISSSVHPSRVGGSFLNNTRSIFHRSNSSSGKQPQIPTASSGVSRNKARQNSSGSLASNSGSKHGGSASSDSNSAQTTPSPTVRPTVPLKLGSEETRAIGQSAIDSANNSSHKSKVASFVEEEVSLKSSKSFASVGSTNNENTTDSPKKEEVYFGANANNNGGMSDNLRSESSCKQSTIIDREPKGVTIFIFGGFVLNSVPDKEGVYHFSTTSEMVKIELGVDTLEELQQTHKLNYSTIHFKPKATILALRPSELCGCNTDNYKEHHGTPGCDYCWRPSPRGYFASAMIDNAPNIVEACELRVFDTPLSKVGSNTTSISYASEGNSSQNHVGSSISENAASFFSRKVLVIHGGVDEHGTTFADMNMFMFLTGRWELMTTYSHDYFNVPKQPFEDDDSSLLTKDKEGTDCPLMEAELRACHHTMLYYKWEDRGYLFFLGGFMNDYLRYFDKEPYYSDKLDVTRFSKFQFTTNNTNLLRIPVLNLQSQTWSYLRYYYDFNNLISEDFKHRLLVNPAWSNARFSHYGGCISINGKVITICHGLVVPVPERKDDLEKLQEDCPRGHLLWGAHVFITFPIM